MAVNAVNLRDFTHDKRQTVDDKPFGGGPGMLMKPEPLFEAVEFLRTKESKVILTGPRGERFSQRIAAELEKTLVSPRPEKLRISRSAIMF